MHPTLADRPRTALQRLGKVVAGQPQAIGDGFNATHFSEEMFDGGMDPLLMVDDFVMTAPTFAPHLHAGISAVTAMFEDSTGAFRNRDTLGHDLGLVAGDLYWLTAARGAVHEEQPDQGARTHALQIFVNLPGGRKHEPARALHVTADAVPVIETARQRVRVVLGSSNGVAGAQRQPEDMTLLDGFLGPDARFAHRIPAGHQAWIYAVSGELALRLGEEERVLQAGSATTVGAGDEATLDLAAAGCTHFVLIAARPVREAFVKHGPLVMSSLADVRRTLVDYAQGRFGRIAG
ncbi:pirin [Massilia sp. KIM]|uniref:pirin family protein n=1 Tax=Massilia sp. KIM TaxID=1955422 RepID=UPI00098EB671|nr:pirin-like C-terminal cupin domain-containing protein [Massilia sp. KIM]OON59949.1 pirin [Massilia sp. KIM]